MNGSNTTAVNRGVPLCLPVDSVTLIRALSAKSADILSIVIARIEAHSISVCQTSFHNLMQKTKKYSSFKTVSTVKALAEFSVSECGLWRGGDYVMVINDKLCRNGE